MATYVHSSGVQALSEVFKTAELTVDMAEGTIFGLDSDGKAVVATNEAGANVMALGVIMEGSGRYWGTGFEEDPNRVKRAGESTRVEFYHILAVDEGTFTNAEVAGRIPIYLGVDGGWTKVDPTDNGTSGTLVQEIGYVIGRSTIRIDLTKDRGTQLV